MKKFKRGLSLLLCLVMAVSLLAGCGDKDSKANGDEYVYVPTYVKVKGDFPNGYNLATYANGKFYFTASVMPDGSKPAEDGSDWSKMVTRLYMMDLDGNTTLMPGYEEPKRSDSDEGYVGTNGISVDKEGNVYVMIYQSTYTFNLPENFDAASDDKWNYFEGSTSEYSMVKVSADGQTSETVDLSGLELNDESYLNNFAVSGDYMFFSLDQGVEVLDMTGAKVFTYTADGWVSNVVTDRDGNVCASAYSGDSQQLVRIDPAAKKGEVVCKELPNDAYDLKSGSGDYDFFYTNGANLYGMKLSGGEAKTEKVLNWVNSNVDSDSIQTYVAEEDGSLLCMGQDYSEDTAVIEMVKLTKTPAKDAAKKEKLTLATEYLDWNLKKAVLKFNKENPDYMIEIKDYSEYNTDDDYSAGLQKLTTEILSGNVPDILYTSGLPVEQMAAKGLLLDLAPYMEKSEDTKLDNLVPAVRNALTDDGKIYRTCQSFSVNTVMGNSDVVGTKMGWTMDDFKKAYASMPAGCDVFNQGTTRDEVLMFIMMAEQDRFVDWSTATCNFDSQDFIDILEFLKLFPETFNWDDNTEWESDYTRIANGKQMLSTANISGFTDLQYYMASFGNKATCVGFPVSEGVGNVLGMDDGYAISAKCANKDVAWKFISQFMSEDWQLKNVYSFPSNQAAFDKQLKDAMTPTYQKDENGNFVLDENGNKIEESKGGFSDGTNEYNFYAMKQAEADMLKNLIDSCSMVMNQNTSLNDIISEEAQAFFNGQKSAADTAKMVQSRVSLYVKEQS